MPYLRFIRLTVIVWLLMLVVSGRAATRAGDPQPVYRAGHFLIMTKPGYAPTLRTLFPNVPFSDFKAYTSWQITALRDCVPVPSSAAKAGADSPLEDIYLVSFPDTIDVREAMSRLAGHQDLRYVEPDYRIEFFAWPADSLFNQQWYLHNSGQGFYAIERNLGDTNDVLYIRYGKPGEDVNLAPIFDNPPGDSVVVIVGIIDTGIDYLHPDLADNIFVNTGETPGNGVDDDHNGLVDDYHGWDFSGDTTTFTFIGDNNATDSVGHGTHVAGLVAAVQNQIGISGYPGRIKVLPIKIFPNAWQSVSMAAIFYALEMGARVINISWGSTFDSNILRQVIHYALDRGCIPVAAAGNFGTSDPTYPASFPECFTVGGTEPDGFMTFFSTYGPFLDIVAPGRDILSLRAAGTDLYAPGEAGVRIIADHYILADGTSMSAPIVSGAAAMLLSFHPGLTTDRLLDALRQSADDLVDPWGDGLYLPGYDTISGWGRLNVGRAFTMVQAPSVYITSPGPNEVVSGDVAVRVAVAGGYDGPVDLYVGRGLLPQAWELVCHRDAIGDNDTLCVWENGTDAGYFGIRVEYANGRHEVNIRVVNGSKAQIVSPGDNDEVKYLVSITGSAYAPDYDSLMISYRPESETAFQSLMTGTDLYFDELIYEWPIFDLKQGYYFIKLVLFSGSGQFADSVRAFVRATMRPGFPIQLPGNATISPGVGDIDGDGFKEIVAGCQKGLFAYRHDGTVLDGFPVLSDKDMRSMPAFDDVDGDGLVDIIAIGQDVIGCYNYRGQALPGWPRWVPAAQMFSSFPIPTLAELYDRADSVILFMNRFGEVYAFKYNGNPYFYSLGGLFTALDPNIFDTALFGGLPLPYVTAADLDGNGATEVIAAYTTSKPMSGIYIWNGRNGLPAFGWETPFARQVRQVHGATLADIDQDGTLEIVASVLDTTGSFAILVTKYGREDLPGWPVRLEGISQWVGSSPVCADINNDGAMEIVVSYYDYDISRVYAFNDDGTPVVENPAVPYGLLLTTSTTLSNMIVADIDGNGIPNLISRSGYVLSTTGYERIFAWEPDGTLTPGFPIATSSHFITSLPFTPLVDDLDADGTTELIMTGNDGGLFVWNLETTYDTSLMIWPKYLRDGKNTGINPHRGTPTVVDDEPQMAPLDFGIIGNHPNPFNPVTTIEFSLDRAGDIRLEIFNILGQRVTTLVSGTYPAGIHRCVWDGADASGRSVASGVYLSRLSGGGKGSTRKMMLIR